LVNQFRPAIEILMYKGQAKLGQSHFGGAPDLPEGTAWPTYNDIPYVFLGQINFEELPDNDVLPKIGLLSIFVAYLDMDYRENLPYQEDEGYILLIHTTDTNTLTTLPIPEDTKSLSHTPLHFSLTGDIGYNISTEDDDELSSPDLLEKHHDLRKALHPARFDLDRFNEYLIRRHQLLGYYQSCQIDDIDPCPKGYIPLIMIDSCPFIGCEWGDGDMMCISIEEDKLKEADFSSPHYYCD